MPAPLKILHLAAPGEIGGLERIVHGLAKGQVEAGEQVSVLAVLDRDRDGDHPFPPLLRGSEARIRTLSLPPRRYLEERRRVAEVIREERPDVVHTHGYRPDVVDSGVARGLGIPTVTTVHGFTGGGWKNRLYERLQRAAFRRFDAVVAVSGPLREHLVVLGVPPERIHVVRNAWGDDPGFMDPVSARKALGRPSRTEPEDEFHLGWVGRLSPEKGPDVVVDALRYVHDLPVHLSVVGDGRMGPSLRERARRDRVSRRISWLGPLPDAARYFPGFDALVLSSRSEGTPVVLFEAMAAGVPIVAARVGGIPDVVSDREAFLVPPDRPRALAEAIRRALSAPDEAARRAGEARRRLRSGFRPEPWVRAYDRVYRSLLPEVVLEGPGVR